MISTTDVLNWMEKNPKPWKLLVMDVVYFLTTDFNERRED